MEELKSNWEERKGKKGNEIDKNWRRREMGGREGRDQRESGKGKEKSIESEEKEEEGKIRE